MAWFSTLPHTIQAILATLFTWGVTAAGAALVFAFRRMNKTLLDAMLGFAAGVMVAASFWSLLNPAFSLAEALGSSWLPVLTGFLAGGALLFAGDRLYVLWDRKSRKDNPSDGRRKRCLMLIFSITLHNIPEGLAVGVAFGTIAYGLEGATLSAAMLLALGIGLQNFPEGTAVSLPLRREGLSPLRAFTIGQLSGIVEPIAGFLGALLAMAARQALPFLLAFAAGAMIYVVVEELIPESQTNKRKDFMALFTLVGFSVMMLMDVALG